MSDGITHVPSHLGFDPVVPPPSHTIYMLYSGLGALLFSAFIVYDTWQLKERFPEDEYVVAAIELYLDIINLFLFILSLLGDRN